MKGRILITDSLYMLPEHHDRLRERGYEIVHYRGAAAPEAELIRLVSDIDGYVLGGIEHVTPAVAHAAARLRGLAFCGSGWTEWIDAHKQLTERGVPITSTAGSNADAVAQFTLGLILAAARNLPAVWGDDRAAISKSTIHEFGSRRVVVIGVGNIGSRVIEMARAVGFQVTGADRKKIVTAEGEDALRTAHIVAVCVNKEHGTDVLDTAKLALLPEGATVVNSAFPDAVNRQALEAELIAERLTAYFDAPYKQALAVSTDVFHHSVEQAAYLAPEAIRRTSDWATESILNLLEGHDDPRIVNPEYARYRPH